MDIQKELKEQTAELHSKAEEHPLMMSFKDGSYKKEHLLQVLVNLRPVYEVVEQRLLTPYIHNNFDLCRSRLISKDIAELYKNVFDDCKIYWFKILPVTKTWVVSQWECSSDLLVSDLYVRWLADFYGGRVFSKTLAPYNNTYSSKDPQAVIKDVRNVIAEHSEFANWSFSDSQKVFFNYSWINIETKHNAIINRAKEFFKYHIQLFDEVYNIV